MELMVGEFGLSMMFRRAASNFQFIFVSFFFEVALDLGDILELNNGVLLQVEENLLHIDNG